MSDRFTPHFEAREFCVSASHPTLVEPLPVALRDYARLLAVLALEPARVALDAPLRITSGYRPPRLNAAVGGSATSQHLRAQAADVQTGDLDALERWFLHTRPAGIGQMIRYATFLHVALVGSRYPVFSPFRVDGARLVAVT